LYCLETGNAVKLPYGFGALVINKRKPAKPKMGEDGKLIIKYPIDWDATNREGRYIYHMNEHTDGFKCKWYWLRSLAKLKLTEIWNVKMIKGNSQLLTKYCRDEENQYYLKYRELNLRKGTHK